LPGQVKPPLANVEKKMKEYFRPGAIFFLRAGAEGF
jgi:3,4-dihydroxy-2-butanone 4-phosphate synthase